MGDPGLHSKFVEMQQEAAFAPRDYVKPENDYVKGLRMDRARIIAALATATHKNHIAMLKRSLKVIDQKLKRKK